MKLLPVTVRANKHLLAIRSTVRTAYNNYYYIIGNRGRRCRRQGDVDLVFISGSDLIYVLSVLLTRMGKGGGGGGERSCGRGVVMW